MAKLNIPQFWYSSDSNDTSPVVSKLLAPISALYHAGSVINRYVTRERTSPIPVICIGNLTMGGAGKTPTARAILKLVEEHGKFSTPCFLMRGYGGNLKGPVEVDPSQHTTWDVGDEALMQARYAPVIVSADRYKGAKLAASCGYDMIIMDDGFQNPKLKKTMSFIVVDGGFGFGNGYTFPSGPLRESVKSGVKRANAAIIVNHVDTTDLRSLASLRKFRATINLENAVPENEKRKVIAFAGIARPEKFFDTLEANGYHLYAHYAFPDHHIYKHGELEKIADRAKIENVGIITTEKDWIRLSEKWRSKIDMLTINLELSDNFKTYFFQHLDRIT